MKTYLGIDLGGTNVRVAKVTRDGIVLAEVKRPSLAQEGPRRVMDNMMEMIREIPGYTECEGIGVGVPGPVDTINGKMLMATNLPGFELYPIAAKLTQNFNMPAYVDNDANVAGLAEALAGGQSAAIYDVCSKTMGGVGIALAMIGVVVCPITSGDTAFRSARLTLADWFKIDQDSYANRLKLCIPVLGVGAFLGIGNALGFINYTVIWRYFSWTNQTLAMIVLWAASMYLFQEKKNYWITAVPATFMSAVSSTYFILAPECLGSLLNSKTAEGATIYNTAVAYPVGVIFAIAMLALFLHATKKHAAKNA